MKEKLQNGLGFVGVLLWYALSVVIVAAPIYATGWPWWACLLVFAVIIFTDFIGSILSVVVWIYAFPVVLSHPITPFSIIFFIAAAIYVIFILAPAIVDVVLRIRGIKK